MPFNGAGVYTAPGADFPAVTQTVISSTKYNNVINDIATALSTCLTKDGQQVATGNIPFGGFRATNVGITGIAGSVGTPAINVSDTQTGLYRSAASELAVTVAGVQVARFDSTGLIITGLATLSGALSATQLTLTTASSRIIPGATSLSLRNNANNADNWLLTDAGNGTLRGNLVVSGVGPNAIGGATDAGTSLYLPGTATSQIVYANGTASPTAGSDAAQIVVSGTLNKAGSGTHANFSGLLINAPTIGAGAATLTNATTVKIVGAPSVGTNQRALWVTSGTVQFDGTSLVLGASPTISVASGSLAITPAVVIAGASLQVGTTPATAGGAILIPWLSAVVARNQANSANVDLVRINTVNSVNDIVMVGGQSNNSNGVVLVPRVEARAATVSDFPSPLWGMWIDTNADTFKLFCQRSGVLRSVTLA